MADRVIACADCGKELSSTYEQLYHCCPQQRAANRKAQQRREKEQRRVHDQYGLTERKGVNG